MSVGGRVAYTHNLGNAIQVVTWEESSPSSEYVAVDVQKTIESSQINPGDTVWWQGEYAYWTPLCRMRETLDGTWTEAQDVKIKRIGYSYAVKEASAALTEEGEKK